MILQLSYLRQLWFYNCYTCANYDFAIVRLAPIMILQLVHMRQLYFTIVIVAPIKILQLLHLRQLYFNHFHTCASYGFTFFRQIMILKISGLRQLYFYNCHTCANYDFKNVILAPIIIFQQSNLRQLWF